ncbi:MAG: class II fructose-bisphosphate aldolase [Candidatus Nealsonbacteria bacterium]
MKLDDYLKRAKKEKWAIGQFNFSTLEQLKAIIRALKNLKSPAIVGTSEGESGFIGLEQAAGLVDVYSRQEGVSVFLNLDHARSFDYIKKAIDAGYDGVHFDGSDLDLEENIEVSKKVVGYAHRKGVVVEGEINPTSGASKVLEKIPEASQKDLTDPKQASRFIKETNVDSLAVNIGSFHGIEATGKSPVINFNRLKEIKSQVTDKFLVLHGGSGVADKDIKEVINNGIVKINVNTELRIAYSNALKQALKNNPLETTPYKLMPEVVDAVSKAVEAKIKLFGSDNKT